MWYITVWNEHIIYIYMTWYIIVKFQIQVKFIVYFNQSSEKKRNLQFLYNNKLQIYIVKEEKQNICSKKFKVFTITIQRIQETLEQYKKTAFIEIRSSASNLLYYTNIKISLYTMHTACVNIIASYKRKLRRITSVNGFFPLIY